MIKEVSTIKEVSDSNGKLTTIIEYEKDNPTHGEYTLWFDDICLEAFYYYSITKTIYGNFRLIKSNTNKYDYFDINKDVLEYMSQEQIDYLEKNSIKQI